MATLGDLGEPEELKIPVVYGHIAAKQWGPKNEIKVLGFHGWLDNARTFDNLAKLLPSNWNLVAIDFPGQGQTSYLPKGAKYSSLQTFVDIRRVVKYLKWDFFHFIAHSFGGRYAVLYASIYPKEVGSVTMIDYMYPAFRLVPENTIEVAVEKFLHLEATYETPGKGWKKEDALKLYATERGLPQDVALPMFERSTKPVGDGKVDFSRDPRLKAFFPDELMNTEELFEMMNKHPLNVLVIDYTKSKILRMLPEMQKRAKEVLEANAGEFQYIEIKGAHYDHIVNPAGTVSFIIDFITKHA